MNNEIKNILFLHLTQLNLNSNSYKIDDNIILSKSENTAELNAYQDLCIRTGFHDGEALYFDTHISIIQDENYYLYYYWEPDSIVSRLCTTIVYNVESPLGLVTAIQSLDNLESIYWFNDIFNEYPIFDLFNSSSIVLTELKLEKIKQSWKNESNLGHNRISIVLSSFNIAWRCSSLEQMCVNLSITIESLFSPSTNNELSHQIAYYVCQFLGDNSKEKEKIYCDFKAFYKVRSSIVHGDYPNQNILDDIVPKIFHYTCKILQKIIIDETLIEMFSSKKGFDELVKQWLFK